MVHESLCDCVIFFHLLTIIRSNLSLWYVSRFLRYMFWSDWGESPKIEKCGMNGDLKTRRKIVTTHILWPNALTIDYTLDRLWWADAKLHTIESSDMFGTQRKIVLSEDIHHPFALTVFHNYMYWTDWEKEAIYKANKFTGEERSTVRENVFAPMDIHVYHELRQPKGEN